MDLETGVLFGIIALIGSNQVLMRTSLARTQPWFFWGINLLDLAVGSLVLVFGLPGYDAFPGVNWLVGLLLVAHVAQNLQLRTTWQQEAREEARLEREEMRREMRQEREEREALEDEA